MRNRLRKYNRAAMSASPTAAYARLHYLVPLALVAIAGLLIVGLRLPDDRYTVPASMLIKSETVEQRYRERIQMLRAHFPEGTYIDAGSPRWKKVAPLYTQARNVAESEGLRCDDDGLEYDYYEPTVYCDTRTLDDSGLLLIFWGSLGLAAICAVLWLFVQFRESWMLPNWSTHLWYTPAYATALIALGIGPFLMLLLYHSRATDYVLGAEGWKLGRLGKEFYLLVFLQLTVLCIAAVELRPSAVRFIIGAPVLLVIAGLAAGLCAVAFDLLQFYLFEPWSWLVPVLVGVLVAFVGLTVWLWRRRRASTRARAPFIGRVFQLSQILLVAWLIYAVDAGLRLGDARTDTMHNLLRTLCVVVCVLHVIGSRWVELRFPERRPAGQRRIATPS